MRILLADLNQVVETIEKWVHAINVGLFWLFMIPVVGLLTYSWWRRRKAGPPDPALYPDVLSTVKESIATQFVQEASQMGRNAPTWTCQYCGFETVMGSSVCNQCGKPKNV
jgi:hypothetical protein